MSEENSLEEFLKYEGESMFFESGDFIISITDGVKFAEVRCVGEKRLFLTNVTKEERIELKDREILNNSTIKEIIKNADSSLKDFYKIVDSDEKYDVEMDNNNWFSLTYGSVVGQEDGEADFEMEDDFVLESPVKSEKDLIDQLWKTLIYAYNN